MGVGLAQTDGVGLARLARNADLTDKLLLCGCQLARCQGLVNHPLEFAAHHPQAAIHIVRIATEIDGPETHIYISGVIALHGIDQAGALAHQHIQTRVHTRATQDIVEEEKGKAAGMATAVGGTAKEDVGLVGAAVAIDGAGGRQGEGAGSWHGCVRAGECFGSSHQAFQLAQGAAEIHIAVDIEHGIVGPIVRTGEAQGIGGAILAQAVGLAQNVAPQVAALEDERFEFVED